MLLVITTTLSHCITIFTLHMRKGVGEVEEAKITELTKGKTIKNQAPNSDVLTSDSNQGSFPYTSETQI